MGRVQDDCGRCNTGLADLEATKLCLFVYDMHMHLGSAGRTSSAVTRLYASLRTLTTSPSMRRSVSADARSDPLGSCGISLATGVRSVLQRQLTVILWERAAAVPMAAKNCTAQHVEEVRLFSSAAQVGSRVRHITEALCRNRCVSGWTQRVQLKVERRTCWSANRGPMASLMPHSATMWRAHRVARCRSLRAPVVTCASRSTPSGLVV